MPRLSQVKLIVNRKLFIVLLFLLFTTHYSLFTSPSLAAPPDPKPCFNPEPTDNLTDNYITDNNGDPAGADGLTFTFQHSGPVGSQPGQSGTLELKKDLTFTADFSKLQAIFGAPTSDYIGGRSQSVEYTQANLLDLKNPALIQKHQGPTGKIIPTAVTDNLRQKYVNYVNTKPDLPESATKFSDYNGQNLKTIDELFSTPGFDDPKPPRPSEDRTNWINTWGKYWENIPTTYNEFYIGKLEFRPVHGTQKIKDLKEGVSCFPNQSLKIVEFPVPNFFRSAATSGVLNQVLLPKSAWSDQNDLMGIQSAVSGVTNTASNFVKNCFKFAINNPVTNILKKAVKISLETLNPVKPVYAVNRATRLTTTQNGCGATGKISATLSWNRADDPSSGLPLLDQEMEISLTSSFSTGYTQTIPLNSSQSSKAFTDYFIDDTDYWWRIHTQYYGVWTTGDNIASFHSNTCAATPACVFSPTTLIAGENLGIILNNFTSGNHAAKIAGRTYGNVISVGSIPDTGGSVTIPTGTTAPQQYDVLVNNGTDVTCTGILQVNAPAGSGNNKAIPISVNQTGCAPNPTTGAQMVSATFTWTPADNPVIVAGVPIPVGAQFLDYSVYNNGWAPGTFQGQRTTVDSGTYTFTGFFEPNTDYYWRINTNYYPYTSDSWSPSATATFKTRTCLYTIDPPVITRVGNNKVVTFTFSPPSDGNIGLFVYLASGGDAVFDTGFIPSGQTQVTWTNSRWGYNYRVVLLNRLLGKVSTEPDVTFDVTYTLDQPNPPGRNVTFTWAPPIHIEKGVNGSRDAMAIIVDKIDVSPSHLAWDSGPLTINSSSITWLKAPPGQYQACIKFNGLAILDDVAENCKTFSVSFAYLWTSFDLKPESCIKVGKAGKAGNAPFCAIYPDKKDPTNTVRNEIEPTKNIKSTDSCQAGTGSILQLNSDSSNVVCTFSFEWRSSDYNLEIPAGGDGNWDECGPESGGFRTCSLTVGIWPDFRVPYLGQIWNNSLYSDTTEWLPTNQQTGRKGVYALLQPKAVAEELAKDPLQIMLDKCVSSTDTSIIPKGCEDLVNWAATHSTEYPDLGTCITSNLITRTVSLASCIVNVARTIVDNKLPGEVSSSNLGVNTGGGNVLAASDSNQKERLIGAVDCGKHFSRDIALKPKVLQQSLGIQQDCNLTASAIPPSVRPPGSPLPSGSPVPPSGNTCPLTRLPDGYTLDNPLGLNFGDPNCDFSDDKLYNLLFELDPANIREWFFTIAACETTNYNPNGYNPVSTSGSAWGLFQMGHQAYPALGIDVQMNNEFDRGDVPWQTQTSNAVNYNKLIGNSFAYWGCR